MTPEEKKLEKLQKLFEVVNEDYATPDDLIQLSEALIGVISDTKKTIDKVLEEEKEEDRKEKEELRRLLDQKEQGLNSILSRLANETDKALAQAESKTVKELKRLEKKIPTRTDLTGIYAEIAQIKQDLTSVPTEITANPEAVRNALELLREDERLDKSAIRGLDEALSEIEENSKKKETNFGFVIRDVTAGTGVTIDKTDPHRPVINSTGSGGGHTIQDEGTPLTQRTNLNFVGAGVTTTDDAGNDATVVTISGSGGGGAVDSVNGETGVVTLTTDDISDTAQTNKWATAAEKTKLGYISVTQAVDLDAIEAASHAAVTVTDSTSIDITLTGQDITAQREALTGAITAPKNSNTTSLGSFTTAQLNTALSDNDVATGGGTATGTNTGDQTSIVGITGTKAQFDTAVTDGNILYVGDVTQYTDEMAQDATGAMVDTTLVYTDLTPSLSRAALTGAITASAGSNTTALGSFTKAQLDTAVSDGNVLYVGDVTTNATHTGEVTGSGALTVDKTAISNRTDTVITASDYILFGDASDTDNLKKDTVQGILDLVSGGTTTNINTVYIDQSGGTSDTYGVLSGTINGSNALFTVSQSVYGTGTLKVWLNGQLQTQGSGEDFVETTPASGTFTFNTAPPTGALITVEYQKVTTSATTIDEIAQDAVGTILTDSAEIDFTYNDGVPSITASLVASSIDESKLDASVNASLDLADNSVQKVASTDNALARFDGAGGAIQNSGVTMGDSNNMAITIADTANVDGLTINQNDVTNNPAGLLINSNVSYPFRLVSTASTIYGPYTEYFHNSASPAANDIIGGEDFYGNDSAANKTLYAYLNAKIDDATNGSEDGSLVFNTLLAGTAADRLTVGGGTNGIKVGDSVNAGVVTSRGDTDLTLQTGNATTGNITITDGANGAITLTPDGTGKVVAGKDLEVPDEAYDATTWNGSLEVPTKNAIRDEMETKQDSSVITANGMGVVVHGATAGTARPTGFAQYTWVGSVEPTNATNNDIWYQTA